MKVLSVAACENMKLNASHGTIEIGFHGYTWTIHLIWKKGKVYFDNNWHVFLIEATILPKDICIFQQTMVERSYRMAVLSKSMLDKYGITEGLNYSYDLVILMYIF